MERKLEKKIIVINGGPLRQSCNIIFSCITFQRCFFPEPMNSSVTSVTSRFFDMHKTMNEASRKCFKFGSTRQIRVITAHPAYKAPGYKAIPLMWPIFIGQNWSYKAGCTVSQIQRIQKGNSLTARPRPGANKRFFSPLNPPPTHVFLSLATERAQFQTRPRHFGGCRSDSTH